MKMIIATNFPTDLIELILSKSLKNEFTFREVEAVCKDKILSEKVEVLLANVETRLDKNYLHELINLRVILSPATGETHIDKEYLREEGIELLSIKGNSEILHQVTSTAEFSWALFLNLFRYITLVSRSEDLDSKSRNKYWSRQVKNMSIGIIGYGRVGRQIGEFAHAFRAQVMATDIRSQEYADYVEPCDLTTLLARADAVFISASVSNSNSNQIILSKEMLKEMKSEAVIINTSRGCLVDEREILSKLWHKQLGGYATDVLATDDIHSNPLFTVSRAELKKAIQGGCNLLVTPHIGGASIDAFAIIVNELLTQLRVSYPKMSYSEGGKT